MRFLNKIIKTKWEVLIQNNFIKKNYKKNLVFISIAIFIKQKKKKCNVK